MFGFRNHRPPLSTFQRVDIELLMRRTIERVGQSWIRDAQVITELSELDLDQSGPETLLNSAASAVTERMPTMTKCELAVVDGSQLGYASAYRACDESDSCATISVADETLGDPLRTVMELAYQYANHFWQSSSNPSDLDTDPRMTNLLPICCGFGVLASDACLYDQQWSQAGWAGWSISRSGYYTAVEIGYAMALLARVRHETKPRWASALRLDSRDTTVRAWRYFLAHEKSGGRLLLDAASIPSTTSDMAQLATWLEGEDRAFGLAAALALSGRTDLTTRIVDAAIQATRSGDKDLVPQATRLLGRGRQSSAEAEARIRELIGNGSPQTCLAAIQSASAAGMPLVEYGATISKLLDAFAEDSFALVDVIGKQGKTLGFLGPKICEHIARAIREIDDELASALLDCLKQIVDDPRDSIQSKIKSPEIRKEALERLSAA